ncbi:MAG: glycerol kinase [Actinobacteria bacterium HGW-Actinobacteria-4]|nr:MAG: glycerol kinase [Actinobacteria bacterium HGW-Actinobacteria-4]
MTYVVAIDQGTTSTRAMIVDVQGLPVASGQLEHRQYFPQPGWVEHDAGEIWRNTREVVGIALSHADITRHEMAAVGIANQRETVVVWDRRTGEPIHRAIVWQDTRTQDYVDRLAKDGGTDRFKSLTGLPLATYFSATKIAWILDHVAGAKERAVRGELLCGTIDTWLVWNLTGGPDGGVHATDVTNASRTLLMDITTLQWSEEQLELFDIPRVMLPEIKASSALYGSIESSSLLREVPIAGILGDQQAATFGQAAFDKGDSKNTYGTGNFLIVNTGDELVASRHGLISTVAYQREGQPPRYALEGSIAVTGSLVQWLRDSLGLFENAADIETLAMSVDDTGGVVMVPAFSGLYAPYWRPEARGAIFGLTRYATRAHIARAALESVAFQSREVIEAAQADTHTSIPVLKVDGGMVANELLLQLQADIWGKPVVRPRVMETTALGAAYAAGLTVGFWQDTEQLRGLWHEDSRWEPSISINDRAVRVAQWHKAVTRTFDWVE